MKEKDEIKQMNEIINKIDIIKDEDWQQKEGETEEEYNRRIEEVENDMEEELLDYISDSLLSEQDIDEKEAIKEAEEKINKDYELFSDAFEKTSEGKIQLKSKEELEKLGYDSQEEYEKLLEIENNFNNPEQYFDKIKESIKKNKDLDSEIDRKMELAKAIISAKKRGEEYSPETYQKANIGKFTKLNDYIADTAVLNRVPMIQEEFIRNNAIEENRYVSFVNNLNTGIVTPNGTVVTGINTMQAIQPIVPQMIPAKKKEVYTNLENKLGEDREQTKQKVLARTELKKAFMEYSEKLQTNKDADITELTSKVLEIKNKFPNIVDIKLIEKIEKEFNVSIDKTAVESKQGNSPDPSQKHKYTRQEIEQTIQEYNNYNDEIKFQKGAIVAVLDQLKSYLEDNKDAEAEKYLHDIIDEIDRIEPIDIIYEKSGTEKKYNFMIIAIMRYLYKNGIKGVDGEILARDENKYAYYTYLLNRRIKLDDLRDKRLAKIEDEYEQNAEDIELKYFLELVSRNQTDGKGLKDKLIKATKHSKAIHYLEIDAKSEGGKLLAIVESLKNGEYIENQYYNTNLKRFAELFNRVYRKVNLGAITNPKLLELIADIKNYGIRNKFNNVVLEPDKSIALNIYEKLISRGIISESICNKVLSIYQGQNKGQKTRRKAIYLKTLMRKKGFKYKKETKNADMLNGNNIYVCSDLHGQYDIYKTILGQLKKDDKLYILGDVIDRGPGGIKILQDIMQHKDQIEFFAGNHELMMIQSLFLQDERQRKNWTKNNGGDITEEEFNKLPKEDQENIRNFLMSSLVYKEIEVNGENIYLVHAKAATERGKKQETVEEFLNQGREDELGACLWTRLGDKKDKNSNQFYSEKDIGKDGAYTIVGHTPTFEGKIEVNDYYADIDCGAAYSGNECLLRLNDGKFVYFDYNTKYREQDKNEEER